MVKASDAVAKARQRARERSSERLAQTRHVPPPDDYEGWLRTHFPHVASKPLGARHRRLWDWFDALVPGQKPRARVEPWPRGGAKSSTGELGVCYVGCKLARRFVLIVSETQDQADRHVQAIATLFERIGIDRSVGRYGNSKGWRRNQLRTANGFNVEALGLDVASRGIKLDEFRPDLILFDDVDNQNDSPKTVARKTRTITASILPAGSVDCAILFLQNLIHENSIVTSLVRGTAEFLYGRSVAEAEPAVRGLEVRREEQEDGSFAYRVVGGEATWEGQDLATCEAQINEWGLPTFRRESQHEVEGADGLFFDTQAFRYCDPSELPEGMRLARGWDLGATQGGGDPTVGALLGRVPGSRVKYVLDVKRERYATNDVKLLAARMAEADAEGIVYDEDEKDSSGRFLRQGDPLFAIPSPKGSPRQRFPQDPGSAGKSQAHDLRADLSGFLVRTKTVTRRKSKRWKEWQADVNVGNVVLVRAGWNKAFVEEHRLAREDEEHEHDDQIDAATDAREEIDGTAPTPPATKKPPVARLPSERMAGLRSRP